MKPKIVGESKYTVHNRMETFNLITRAVRLGVWHSFIIMTSFFTATITKIRNQIFNF